MITERTLRKWRKEALTINDAVDNNSPTLINTQRSYLVEISNRILRLTQELLDQHLLRK